MCVCVNQQLSLSLGRHAILTTACRQDQKKEQEKKSSSEGEREGGREGERERERERKLPCFFFSVLPSSSTDSPPQLSDH